MCGEKFCMEESPSRTAHASRCPRISTTSTAFSLSSSELQTGTSPSISDSLRYSSRAKNKISCGFSSFTQLGSNSDPVNLLCSESSIQALRAENIPVQASMTTFRGFIKFSTILHPHCFFRCARIHSLYTDTSLLLL